MSCIIFFLQFNDIKVYILDYLRPMQFYLVIKQHFDMYIRFCENSGSHVYMIWD